MPALHTNLSLAVAGAFLVLRGVYGMYYRLQEYGAATFDPDIEVVIKNYYEARKQNVETIVDGFCGIKQVAAITVLYENESVVPTHPACAKARYTKSPSSIFERYNGCFDVQNYVLTNDDDILIPRWSFDAMASAAKSNPNSIVGSFGRKGDPDSAEPYSNPFGGFGENMVLVGAALYPCRFLEGYRNFIRKWDERELEHCDDIIFNRWIKFKYKASHYVAPRWSLHPIQYLNDSSGGLHGQVKSWDQTRNNCVRWAWKHVNSSSVHL